MIKALFWRDNSGNITHFKVTGHAGFADLGEDIICSGVSALIIAIINGLTEIADIPISYQIDNGYVDCTILPGLSSGKQQQAQLLLETLAMGLESIQADYEQYIKVRSIAE